MLFCLEDHMRYRVARSTLHGRKIYLTGLQEVNCKMIIKDVDTLILTN